MHATRRAGYILLVILFFSVWLGSAFGQPAQQQIANGPLLTLRATTGREGFRVPARPTRTTRVGAEGSAALAIQSANINVTYSGFSAEAQTAFEFAVNIWEQQISSPVQIEVSASWAPLSTGVLGSASPYYIIQNFSGAPVANTWYPIALANKLHGSDLAPGAADISATFSSARSDWYYGTDGNVPAGQIDLVSVVLHELGHGLGFYSSTSVDGSGSGSLGYSGSPVIYDRFTADSAGTPLLSYTSPSTALGTALKTSPVYFTGTQAKAANGNANVRLYAPSTWAAGSSYAHLDNTFDGTSNALMTYSLSYGESIHDPGNVTLGVLTDIGWTTSAAAPTNTPTKGLSKIKASRVVYHATSIDDLEGLQWN